MKSLALEAEKRDKEEIKNNSARRLGSLGYIPAIMYGLNKEPVSIKVSKKDITKLLKGHSISSVIFDINIDKKDKSKDAVIIKEYQKDPISNELIHLDFLRIQMKKEIETSVPVKIINEDISIGIKEEGGVLQHGLRELHISCLPADIPEYIEYDIKDLKINDIIRVENIVVDEKIKLLNDPSEVVISIIPPSELKEEELEAEEEVEEKAEEPEIVGHKKPAEEAGTEAEKKQKEPGKE
jgi:large subunit ribosomal protein L25